MKTTTFDDWPDYNAEAMGCGLEDRNITDRYEAMRYGWDQAIERVAERLDGFTHPPAQPDTAALQARIAELEEYLQNSEAALYATLNQKAQLAAQAGRNSDRVALSDAALNRMWLELTDEHVISKAAFFAVYRAILATQADAPFAPDGVGYRNGYRQGVADGMEAQANTQPLIAEAARDDVAKNRKLSSPDVIAAIAARKGAQ